MYYARRAHSHHNIVLAFAFCAAIFLSACGSNEDASQKKSTRTDKESGSQENTTAETNDENGGTIATDKEQNANETSPDNTEPADDQPPARAWKGVLLTGDHSIRAFDNARKKLKSLWTAMGVLEADLKELSMTPSEQTDGVLASNRENLKKALGSLDLGDNDGCIVHMTSHGSKQGFYMADQSTLKPNELDSILTASCGQRPTVVLISACYSGVFVDSKAMQKPNRIILSAARPDRTSFGCGVENEYTYWDGCLVDNFAAAQSWSGFYDTIKSCIEDKESRANVVPSEPQAFFGEDVKDLPVF